MVGVRVSRCGGGGENGVGGRERAELAGVGRVQLR